MRAAWRRRQESTSRRAVATLIALLACAAGARVAHVAEREITHITPRPQPPLAVIADDSLAPLRQAFNHAADRPRILLMLSPT